ncbi:MAG TPA: hypothetical protein VG265_09860 [Gaiellaceae bacterium]|jgi:uncharacterized protein YndB with AHSA1/START domain|nr:hypothetical protein [Gaiellaceae bacterium]
MTAARRELLASRAEVWGFLAEPYHLSDWWPGILSVDPDRRGFAPGARWNVQVIGDPPGLGPVRFPRIGRPSGPPRAATLVITGIEPYERWAWQLIRRVPVGRDRAATQKSVEIELRAVSEDRTEVVVTVESSARYDERLALVAANRLYDLIQTAATL